MLFNSVKFIMFFPLVSILYYITNHKYRWILLLIASYYFYMSWKPIYALLMFLTTFITYITAILIDKAPSKKSKKIPLLIGLISNLGILFVFKYLNFINLSFNSLFNWLSLPYELPTVNLLLPVGISFYTFQALGYTIDVYREDTKVEKHFGIFALFLSFFPQLVAGPIERSNNLLPQFHEKHELDFFKIRDGFALILWGFFKKVVIADKLAVFVDLIYNQPQNYTGVPLILATVFFAFQIFCDFSGYSDIAIGCANILGFDLMNNFNKPYTAKSIPDFWRRWHISLSTWFKDYVYIPLGGNRVSKKRWCLNQFIVFFLSGLWHGANWTFVIWGILHGIFIVLSHLTKNARDKFAKKIGLTNFPKLHSALHIIVTFILVDFAWIFFRANSLSDAIYISNNLFTNIRAGFSWTSISNLLSILEFKKFDFLLAIASIIFLELIHRFQGEKSIAQKINEKPILIRWGFYYLMLFAIILLGGYGCEESSQFIYFQF